MPFRDWLTVEQERASDVAPKYDYVTPEMLFGPNADSALSLRVHKNNLRKYKELKLEHRYRIGELKRPVEHYDHD